jgi:HSP20 family protein
MRTLVSLHPLAEFKQMVQSMDRAFDTLWGEATAPNLPQIPVDIYERDGSLFVSASIPGIRPEDLDITVEEGVLTIRGETKQEWESNETKVYRREQRFGQFARSIQLPDELDLDRIDAEFQNGMVTVRIPKMEAPKPQSRKVLVRNASGQSQPMIQHKSETKPAGEKATNGQQDRETAGAAK